MKTATEIVRSAPYGRMHVWCKKHQCRHPIDKPCDASVEAYRLEFEAEVREVDRQRKKKERAEKSNDINNRVQDAPVENIEKSPDKVLSLNAIGKPYGANYDPNYRVKTPLTNIKRLYAPMKPAAPPSSPWETLLEKGWLQATPKAKRQFLRKYWDEILREKSAADDERITEDAPSLVAVEPVSAV